MSTQELNKLILTKNIQALRQNLKTLQKTVKNLKKQYSEDPAKKQEIEEFLQAIHTQNLALVDLENSLIYPEKEKSVLEGLKVFCAIQQSIISHSFLQQHPDVAAYKETLTAVSKTVSPQHSDSVTLSHLDSILKLDKKLFNDSFALRNASNASFSKEFIVDLKDLFIYLKALELQEKDNPDNIAARKELAAQHVFDLGQKHGHDTVSEALKKIVQQSIQIKAAQAFKSSLLPKENTEPVSNNKFLKLFQELPKKASSLQQQLKKTTQKLVKKKPNKPNSSPMH